MKAPKNGEDLSILLIGLTIGLGIIYLFWVVVIYIITWSFDLEFSWTYPLGFAIIFWIGRNLFKR